MNADEQLEFRQLKERVSALEAKAITVSAFPYDGIVSQVTCDNYRLLAQELEAALALPEDRAITDNIIEGWRQFNKSRVGNTLPEDSKVVNAELYGLAIKLADAQAREEITFSMDCDNDHYYPCSTSFRYLSLREASGEPMPYKVIRDGDKVRFE